MKKLGSLLMMIGLLIGAVLGVGIVAGVRVNGIPYLMAVGLAKLTFVSALGFLAAGAVVRRLGVRDEQRARESIGDGKDV